jgi:hypothetical protein
MAHFAKISEENEVLSVHVVNNADILDNGVESETKGQNLLSEIHGWPANLFKQCSYHTSKGVHSNGGTPLRANFPSVGFMWHENHNIFSKPKPYASWTLDTTTGVWNPPVAKPAAQEDPENKSNIRHYSWNEVNQQWDILSEDIWVGTVENEDGSVGDYVDSQDPIHDQE